MSRMIPQETIDALRQFNEVTLINYGIACTIYNPTNLTTVETEDAYAEPTDYTFTELTDQLVFIEWSPTQKRLRKFGLFMEDSLPILAWFKHSVDVRVGSYIKVPFQYVDETQDTDEFDVVEVLITASHDATAVKGYRIAPRRVKTA